MDEARHIDLSALTFDEFVEFYFQRPENEEFWYQDPQYNEPEYLTVSNSGVFLDHATQLFIQFGVIARRYSPAQIDHGIWALLGYGPMSIDEHLWETSVPLEKRVWCLGSMLHVYSDFVATSPENEEDTCFYMWWDQLGDYFWNRAGLSESKDSSQLDRDRKMLLDTMFDTLKDILALPNARTRHCALHGLGHLHHPGVRPLIQSFIEQNSAELDEHEIEWIEKCRDGTVM